jgi:flagellar biosynthesis protein FliQ
LWFIIFVVLHCNAYCLLPIASLMTEADVLDVLREGIYVLILTAAPAMIVSLTVGIIVSLFQALTQIQEPTLTFVPKMLAMLLTLIITLPFMINMLIDYTHKLNERIIQME